MKQRKINIEFIRVFAAFMTVMIHVSNFYINHFGKISRADFFASVTYNSLARVCVPLFFMVSGMFLVTQEFDMRKYFERIIRFLIVLVVWSCVYFFLDNNFTFQGFGKTILASFFNANYTSRHLWFLYAILGIYIALPFINNMCKNLTSRLQNLFLILWLGFSGLVVITVPLARFVTNSDIDITYPIPIINSAYYLGYFISGHILYQRFKDTTPSKNKTALCLGCYTASMLVTIFFTYFFSVKENEFFAPFTWYRGIFIILASFAIFILIIINEDKIKHPIILKISKHSFGVYLIHMIIFNKVTENIDILNLSPAVWVPLISVGVYIISLLCSAALSKIPILKRLV